MRTITEVIADVDALNTAHEDDLDLDRLYQLAKEYFVLEASGDVEHLDVWFRLYERYPDSDGYGVFWTILHGIEHVMFSPTGLLLIVNRSLQRKPTYFPLLIVSRMRNTPNITSRISERVLLDLLHLYETDERCDADLRISIQGFLE